MFEEQGVTTALVVVDAPPCGRRIRSRKAWQTPLLNRFNALIPEPLSHGALRETIGRIRAQTGYTSSDHPPQTTIVFVAELGRPAPRHAHAVHTSVHYPLILAARSSRLAAHAAHRSRSPRTWPAIRYSPQLLLLKAQHMRRSFRGRGRVSTVHVTWVGNCPLKLTRPPNRQVSLEKRTAATEAWRTRCFLLLPARVQGFMVASAPCGGTYTQGVPALGPCQAVAAYSIRLPACVHCPLAPCPMHAVEVVRAPAECETDCCLVAP